MMTPEFYQKSTSLYETFRKSELHYLNLERNTNGALARNYNLPYKDYLEKINKREKESEELYRILQKTLDEMAKHTHQMSSKLDKLNTLRSAALNACTTNWSFLNTTTLTERPLFQQQCYSDGHASSYPISPPTTKQATVPPYSDFNPSQKNNISLSQAAQTEDVVCDKCSCGLTSENTSFVIVNRLPKMQAPIVEDIPNFSKNLTPDASKKVSPSKNTEIVISNSRQLNHLESLPVNSDSISHNDFITNPKVVNQENKDAYFDIVSKAENYIHVSANAGVSNKSNISAGEENPGAFTQEGDSNTVRKSSRSIDKSHLKNKILEQAASRSDDESINHEFDFLESERVHIKNGAFPVVSKQKTTVINLPTNSPIDTNDHAVYAGKTQYNETTKDSHHTTNSRSSKVTKNYSSLSDGSPSIANHSADVSNHSDSDSLSDKETPLSVSDAYKALLINAVVPKAPQKQPSTSETDSEDEVENVLSSAVRRTSNINFQSLTQTQEKNEKKVISPEAVAKTNRRPSKSAPTWSSQLSKNTRKALNLEASSGSEIELEVKSKTQEVDEDSDDFFYN